MKILRGIFLLIAGFLAGAIAVIAQDIKANAVDIVLTPPLEMGYTLGGYGARMSRPAEGVHDDIRAKALVLDNGAKKYAIVTLDVLGLPPNVKPMVVKELGREEWTEKNILFLPSHAHTSLEMFALNDKNIFDMPPIGIYQPRLLDYVVSALAGLIRSADQDLQPVKTGTSSVQIDGRNRNRRRNPHVDNDLTVTRIDRLNGKPLSVLVNWTAHPTIMDENDMLVSGGWPGYLQRELEALIGGDVVAMYYNGAEGDQSVIAGSAGSHYEKAELYGRGIALEAMKIYETIQPAANAIFDYNHHVIELPQPRAHPDFMETGGREYGLNQENIQGLLNQICPGQTSVGAFRLGDLLIVGAPGEMIAELGLEVKNTLKEKGIRYPAIGGLANQWVSYILSEEEYNKTGYENSMSFYGKELGNIIVNAMLETAGQLIR